jgi:tRNA threonylcarbamoyladenosine modification (KEOPS) complex Cgi121 subunit
MRSELVEYGKTIEIMGYRGINFHAAEAYLKANRKQTQNCEIQFFDADLIVTFEHLYFAAVNAFAAFKTKTNISKSPAMETMLYATAQHQIQKAIEQAGIKPESQNMAVLIIGNDAEQVGSALKSITKAIGARPDETVLEMTQTKIGEIKKAFGISDRELLSANRGEDLETALINLVIERMALVSTKI